MTSIPPYLSTATYVRFDFDTSLFFAAAFTPTGQASVTGHIPFDVWKGEH